jgi:hypothetical protein
LYNKEVNHTREKKMYKVEIATVYGPFCGEGGYGTETCIGFDRSVKRAFAKARGQDSHRYDRSQIVTGSRGGGVPVLGMVRISHNGKIISEIWD